MKRFLLGMAAAWLGCSSVWAQQPAEAPATPASGIVKKVAESFDDTLWVNDQWNTGKGKTSLSSDVAPNCNSKKSMQFDAIYSGKGFEGITVVPPQPLVVPGDLKNVTLRIKHSDKRYDLKISFLDGWGREKASDGKAMEWVPRLADTPDWQTFTFKVPANWVQPVTIAGFGTHNWETKGLANTVTFLVDQLEVETDIRQVDPATGVLKTWVPEANPANPAKAIKEAPKTPLVDVSFSTGVESNVFAGEEPKVTLNIRNWKNGTLTGKANCQVLDDAGKVVSAKDIDVSVDAIAAYALPLPMEKFGRYTLKASLSLSDGTKRDQEMVFAKLPALKNLTEEQKVASPYGLNVHSGDGTIVIPFKKAGLIWFREYAFQWDWVTRAKGADSHYAGWPYYPKMVQSYTDAGVKILPVIQKSVVAPTVKDGKIVGKIGPDGAWKREMGTLMSAFPQITHWELSNEYDLPNANSKAEELCNWANYRAYHKAFADVLELMGGDDKVAVENGRAGIWPKREHDCVMSGDFDKIKVINSHHYCGTDAPEVNFVNFNMGFDASEQQLGSFYDVLHAAKQAGQADGKKREHWLTEFGWDTLAGPVVSPYEQAVFLSRAWMVAMAAGTDKAFWFYNFDSADAKSFFDGCGLLSAKREPKLSLCSMAGLTSVLPAPHYVGSLNAGDNTWGYVFENEGKLVASLWTIKGDDGPKVNFKAEQLYDYLGNKVAGTSAQLTMAPVFAVGLDKGDTWYKQTAYELKTPLLTGASPGDLVTPTVTVTNNRQEPINCKIAIVLPEGWNAEKAEVSATVAPGAKQDLELPYTVGLQESQGLKEGKLVISEGAKVKEMPIRILLQPAVTMQVSAIVGKPGTPASATVKLANLSVKTQNATLRVKAPASWQVATPTIAVADLKPKETREVKVGLTWSPNWQPQESASVEMDAGPGKKLTQPLIPNEYRLYSARGIKLDGDLADWPAKNELPNWILGSTIGASNAKVYAGWAKEGLYVAVEVHDSRAVDKDPKSFWAGDALELFIDSQNNKQGRSAYQLGDHQFWFVPMTEKNRVYVGQWKHDTEIAANLEDIQGIYSAAKKTADGYVMEFMLPAEKIQKFQPAAGSKIGLNLNLTVRGQQADRQVYWPNTKSSGALNRPETWGTLELAD